MEQNGSFKKKKVYFSQVSNLALRDSELSLKAKGLYALIQSYITLEDFTLYKTTLKNKCKEGEKAFESTWKELKDRGYLLQNRYKNSDGLFCYEYELLDQIHTPKMEVVDNVDVVKVDDGNRSTGKGRSYNKTKPNNTDLNNTNSKNTYIHKRDKKVDNFNNFEQRTYDFNDLEKQLLGWE